MGKRCEKEKKSENKIGEGQNESCLVCLQVKVMCVTELKLTISKSANSQAKSTHITLAYDLDFGHLFSSLVK